eukprot:CAMPEP_0168335562 /NCGR_PEP_ID=MMETSP0213-20121227/10984_1 /TAXON_ID=151035 /ORGANISM="Euplotes harpa, Strain FSP1.4" /LENGTH=37 /DNA_ID= /DNA_START= /DNA_END= /DNA_ORIENTATION=
MLLLLESRVLTSNDDSRVEELSSDPILNRLAQSFTDW